MKTIYKYPIQITDVQEVALHHKRSSKLIYAGLDPNGVLSVWAEVDADATETMPVTLYVVGTGNPMPQHASRHIGSFLQGPFVWHIYV